MKIKHNAYLAQASNLRPDPAEKPTGEVGYDMKTLQRLAFFDMHKDVEVFRITIVNDRGECGQVFVRPDDLAHAIDATLGNPVAGVKDLAIDRQPS